MITTSLWLIFSENMLEDPAADYEEEMNPATGKVKLQRITASHLNLFGDASNGKEITVTIKLYTAKRKKIT